MKTSEIAEQLVQEIDACWNPQVVAAAIEKIVGDADLVPRSELDKLARNANALNLAQTNDLKRQLERVQGELKRDKREWRTLVIRDVRHHAETAKGKGKKEGIEWALKAFEYVGGRHDEYLQFAPLPKP